MALNPSSAYTEAASIQAILTPYVGVTYLRGELAFHTRSATAGGSGSDVTAMYINGDGNVGIGTTAPAYQLEVANLLGLAQLRLQDLKPELMVYTQLYILEIRLLAWPLLMREEIRTIMELG